MAKERMQTYLFTILSVSAVAAYFCIKDSVYFNENSSTSIESSHLLVKHDHNSLRQQTQQPLIHDFNNDFVTLRDDSDTTIVKNVQGSVPHPTVRRSNGLLPHRHVATKDLGSVEYCTMEGNRIKHKIISEAASLDWKHDASNGWEIYNDRGNSNPDVDIKNFQYIVIKDAIGTEHETITEVDQAVSTTDNDVNATEGEWMGQDPRVILYNGRRIIIFHSAGNRQMWLYDDESKQSVMLTICGHGVDGIQKNWSPVIVSDTILLLVYTIDPLVILQYDVDKGDGVCRLLYGHLPLRSGMDEPYGGTPFVEITSSLDDSADNGIVARSFLSMGHTRKGNDLISKGRQKGHRIYRPVPLLLHIFCVRTDDNGYGIDTLEGCTFGTDTFDLWHEVESPEFLLETKWKKTVRKARSISFPYDLHIFRQNNIMRMGLVYEDCYSVYQDYEIDFDAISDLHQTHPMRIALESGYIDTDGAQEANTMAFSPTLVQSSTSTHCLSRYSHTGEEKLYVTPVAEEDDLAKRIANHTWIVTHQYKQMPIRKRLKLNNILSKASSSRNDIQELGSSQLDAILRHYPYPIKQRTDKKNNNTLIAPTLCIYVYGSM